MPYPYPEDSGEYFLAPLDADIAPIAPLSEGASPFRDEFEQPRPSRAREIREAMSSSPLRMLSGGDVASDFDDTPFSGMTSRGGAQVAQAAPPDDDFGAELDRQSAAYRPPQRQEATAPVPAARAVAPPPGGGGEPQGPESAASRYIREQRRRNNLGNLRVPGRSEFQTFDSPEAGVAAMVRQLGLYAQRGITSVQDIVSRWAPRGDGNNDPDAYATRVARDLGVSPTDPLDLSNPQIMTGLVRSMATVEQGRLPDNADDIIAAGVRMAAGGGQAGPRGGPQAAAQPAAQPAAPGAATAAAPGGQPQDLPALLQMAMLGDLKNQSRLNEQAGRPDWGRLLADLGGGMAAAAARPGSSFGSAAGAGLLNASQGMTQRQNALRTQAGQAGRSGLTALSTLAGVGRNDALQAYRQATLDNQGRRTEISQQNADTAARRADTAAASPSGGQGRQTALERNARFMAEAAARAEGREVTDEDVARAARDLRNRSGRSEQEQRADALRWARNLKDSSGQNLQGDRLDDAAQAYIALLQGDQDTYRTRLRSAYGIRDRQPEPEGWFARTTRSIFGGSAPAAAPEGGAPAAPAAPAQAAAPGQERPRARNPQTGQTIEWDPQTRAWVPVR